MALAIGQENGDCRLSGSNGAKKYANASSLLDTWAVTHYALPMRPTREELHQLVQHERKLKNRLQLATTHLEEAERERIWAIVAAHDAGLSIRKIAAATGLSRSRIHQLLQEPVVSLDSVYEIRTTRACSLYPPEARDTIHIRSAPSAPVFRGWWSAGRVSEAPKQPHAMCALA